MGVQRATNGRFVAGQKRPGASPAAAPSSDMPGMSGVGGGFKTLSDSIGRLSTAMAATDNIDPTMTAMKEVTDVVAPLGRGLFSMFGRTAERKKERWYQRIWKALTSPAGARSPTTTGGGGGGGGGCGGGGLLGGVGGMLKIVPALLMAVFSRILLPIAALWGAFELGQWVGKKIYEWLESSGLMTKIFNAFDSIGSAFSSAWSSVTSGIDTVVSGISTAWKATTDAFIGAIDSFMTFPAKIGEVLSGIDDALRKLPIIGGAYAKAADAVKSVAAPVAEVGTQAKAGYDVARGNETTAGAPANIVEKSARAVGGGVGTAINAGSNAGLMLKAGRDAGMGNKELANFMGQNAHESGGFTTLKENTNFTPEQLLKNFKGRNGGMNTIEEARAIHAGGQGAIGEAIYGGAWGKKNLGNTEEGDGLKFKGSRLHANHRALKLCGGRQRPGP